MQLALFPPRVRVRTSARCRARHRAHLSEPSATAPGHVEPPCRSCRAISSECFVKLPALVFLCDCCHTPGDDVPLGGRPPPRVPCAGATPAWDGSAAVTSDGPSRRRCRRGRRKRFRDPGPDAPVPGISASPSSPRTDADTAPSVSAPTGPGPVFQGRSHGRQTVETWNRRMHQTPGTGVTFSTAPSPPPVVETLSTAASAPPGGRARSSTGRASPPVNHWRGTH